MEDRADAVRLGRIADLVVVSAALLQVRHRHLHSQLTSLAPTRVIQGSSSRDVDRDTSVSSGYERPGT